jgi:hypothetical protein
MATLLWTLGLFIALTIAWHTFVWLVRPRPRRIAGEPESPPQRFMDEYRRHRSS